MTLNRNQPAEGEFLRGMHPAMARRQFTISAGLIAALAIGTVMIAGVGKFQPRYSEPAVVKLTVQVPGTLEIRRADTRHARTGG